MAALDFDGLARQILGNAENLVSSWLPGGRKRGDSWCAGNLSGESGESLKVKLSTGAWSDFATGEHGSDLISLYAAINDVSMGDAFRQLGGEVPHTPRLNGHARPPAPPPEPERRVVTPVPDASADCECIHPRYGKPARRWTYFDGNGDVLGYVARYEPAGQRKQILPWTFDGDRWGMGQWPAPRPLYGLHELHARPDAAVLVVEGEKAADAAAEFCKPYVVMTWPAGAMAADKADWTPMRGRKVLLWPDADEPGVKAMQRVAQIISPLAAEVKIVKVDGQPDGWDAADAEFRTWKQAADWIRPRASLWSPSTSEGSAIDPETGEIIGTVEPTAAPEPIDLFAEIPVPPIRREMLPDVIADYAFDHAELVGVEASMIAMPALVTCAAALHDDVQLQVKRHEKGWRESARLWCAVVGNPSIKKSPSIRHATSRLRKIDSELHDANDAATAKHLEELEAYKEAKKEAKKTGGNPSAPQPPKRERMIVEDVTVEALSEVLKDNPRGILCLQDELSGWFGSMDAYSGGKAGGKDRAHWLEAYNGGGRVVDRVMRGNLKIQNWSVSMIGGIQPDAIRRIAQNMPDDGLMQRFMIVVGRNAQEYDREANPAYGKAYASLVDYMHSVMPSDTPVTMTEEAHCIREELNRYASDLANYPAMPAGLRSHLGKWSGLFARLALLFHAIECHRYSRHPASAQVSGETAARVDLLMRRFLLPHAMAYYTDVMGAATELEHARWIAGHVLSNRLDVLTQRDIHIAYRQWRGLDEWRRVRVMQTLEDMGWIVPVEDDRKSRRGAHTWAVNTRVHDLFAEKAQQEAETRERMKEEFVARRFGL